MATLAHPRVVSGLEHGPPISVEGHRTGTRLRETYSALRLGGARRTANGKARGANAFRL